VEESVVALSTPESLTRFIREMLCEHDRLDPSQTPFFQTPLKRNGQPCGILYHVEGPRLLRTSAIWATDEHRILFYDSTGTRFNEIRLSESPSMPIVNEMRHAA
jgi:hypothetical protein